MVLRTYVDILLHYVLVLATVLYSVRVEDQSDQLGRQSLLLTDLAVSDYVIEHVVSRFHFLNDVG